MSKPKFPVVITERGVTAKIRKATQTKNGEIYTHFVIDYVLLGKRKREARASFDGKSTLATASSKRFDPSINDLQHHIDRVNNVRAIPAPVIGTSVQGPETVLQTIFGVPVLPPVIE